MPAIHSNTRLVLLVGGARSGKSTLAVDLGKQRGDRLHSHQLWISSSDTDHQYLPHDPTPEHDLEQRGVIDRMVAPDLSGTPNMTRFP